MAEGGDFFGYDDDYDQQSVNRTHYFHPGMASTPYNVDERLLCTSRTGFRLMTKKPLF